MERKFNMEETNVVTQVPQPNTNPSEQPAADSRGSILQTLEETVVAVYDFKFWMALKAGLGAVCSLALRDRSHPLAMITKVHRAKASQPA
jgi:hypothetical protein